MSEIVKSNESLLRGSNNRLSLPAPSLNQSLDDHSNGSTTSDGIYAKIPADEDEEYLTMKEGVSIENLVQSGPIKSRSSSSTNPQSVIKKLQLVTHWAESNSSSVRSSVSPHGTPRRSPAREKRESSVSVKSFQSARISTDASVDLFPPHSPMIPRSTEKPVINRRPLPQSPVKLRKMFTSSNHLGYTSPTKRKNSGSDGNIYESIDGEQAADWLKQLKQNLSNGQDHMGLENVLNINNQQCNQILEHFLLTPEVQELWKSSVRSVYPDFSFPEEFLTVPPLLINPQYFVKLSLLDDGKSEISENDKSLEVVGRESHSDGELLEEGSESTALNKDLLTEEPLNHARLSNNDVHTLGGHPPLCEQESLTDRVLAELNKRLLLQQDSSSEEEDSESEDEYSESSDSDGKDDTAERTDIRSGISLSTIHEHVPNLNDDDLITPSETLDRRDITKFSFVKEERVMEKEGSPILRPTHQMNKYGNNWLKSSNSQIVVSVGQSSDDEEADSSSSPDTPPGNLHNPAQLRSSNHLTISHVNSLDSGISANGNNCVDD